MDTLLVVAIVLIALSIIVQAGALLGMFLMSRRLSGRVENLVNETQKLMPTLESITKNLKVVSDDMYTSSKLVRDQVQQLQLTLTETRESIQGEISEIRQRIESTLDEARALLMRPVREWSAV